MPTHQRKIGLIVSALLQWYSKNARDLPWRRTTDPYSILVSEIMLQQTRVQTVIPYYERWMEAFPDLAVLAKARPERVLRLWAGLGYYSRARRLQESARRVFQEHGGVFPRSYEEVLALPGVGRYTAGAVCSIAFGDPVPILDGNVTRVLTRLFGHDQDPAKPSTKDWLWTMAGTLVLEASKGKAQPPSSNPCGDLNQALMELGALVCTPSKPSCRVCPCSGRCGARAQNAIDRIPFKSLKINSLPIRSVVALVESEGRYLVRRRPTSEVNGGFWEFPCAEVKAGEEDLSRLTDLLPSVPAAEWRPIGAVRHAITKYRYSSFGYACQLRAPSAIQMQGAVWKTLGQLRRIPLVTAHRRLIRNLGLSSAETEKRTDHG